MGNSPIVNRINALLAEKGIQKRDFYRDCGITSASYSLWNTGKTTPRKKNLDIIARYLGTSTDYLLTGLGEKAPAIEKVESKMTIGERICAIRIRKGLSQQELGERCHIAEQTIRKYESGALNLEFEAMDKIASALEVPVQALMGYVFTGRTNGKDVYDVPMDVVDVVVDEKKPAPTDGDGLGVEQLEILRLYNQAPASLQAAALAVLKSAEGQGKAQGGVSTGG